MSGLPTCIEDISIVVPGARPVALMDQDPDQLVGNTLLAIRKGRGRGQVRAVRAQERRYVKAGLKRHVACQLDEVWPEALEMEGKGIGSCVDVKGLVGCLIPATQYTP